MYTVIFASIFLSALLGFILQSPRRHFYYKYIDLISILDPPGWSMPQLLQARAQPNARLIHTFRLGNTFVSADARVRKEFIARAREVLHKHTRDFRAFPNTVRGFVGGVASHIPHHHHTMPFATFIQVVTFRVVVDSLLEGNIPEEEDENIVTVVEAINELWMLSKKRLSPIKPVLQIMDAHLKRWLPTYARPLDFVIPAYETMWRVVAVTVARANQDPGARTAFARYLNSPLEAQFVRFNNGQPSVEVFMCEILRLHPPSRHLSRTAPARLAGLSLWYLPHHTYVADLEALHRDTAVWGNGANVFDPSRFHASRITHEQRNGYIPFSYGPLRCVAFKEAPRFAACVAAAILEIVSGPDAKYRLTYGKEIGWREGWDGWTIEKTC
ncbi:hypothetical protein B0F90DRAFT_1639670 [Multifurca ochricompacta]|uniref:Cytochrome P450 n=1 Tax=Multifurca ochricompacta TaxID=376703 RepID=A0AAD4LYI7_9AGAM|nr:hypothetical protein B0F90DRAFT_1639670 [Multifurca ochricompacta]